VHPNLRRPTAKRSPSILVTDSRSHNLKGARAPFAGHNYKKQQQQQVAAGGGNYGSGGSSSRGFLQEQHEGILNQRFGLRNKLTDISVDKLLSNSSDIPSGQSRLPSLLSSTKKSSMLRKQNASTPAESGLKKNIRSIPKLSQSLPSRTSKTSQKLVLFPEHQRFSSLPPLQQQQPSTTPATQPSSTNDIIQISRSRAELMAKEKRADEFPRTTAYFICEQFNLLAVSKFLRENHEVKPRLYEEALYVHYALPLLPGTDGYRVKSNNSAKMLPNKRYMEKMINKTEQTNHLYEYYSGVETPEDAQNYSMDPEQETNTPFDPSEPQFFPPEEDNVEDSNSGESKSSTPASDNESGNSKLDSSSHHNQSEISKHHAEMFIFEYGIVVFWNFSEIHEKNILADLAFASDEPDDLVINPIDEQDIETEEFHFEYDSNIQRPRIYNDMITLRSADHLIKLTMSHAIAQSTKLCLFESRMVNVLQLISKLPKKLALTGTLGLKRTQLLKKTGKLFKLRVDVNLSNSILDTPDFFWDLEPALHPLYNAVREYLEIDQRVQVLNDRCKVFLEFLDIISDSINEKNTNRVAWMIIIIIFMSLAVSLFEFVLEIL
jgi:uncharacterized Rmd1/YagE family protein